MSDVVEAPIDGSDVRRPPPIAGQDTARPRAMFVASVWAMLAVLVLFSPALLVMLGWFTEGYSDTPDSFDVSHRLHEVLFGVLFSIAVTGAVTQLRSPLSNTAGFAQLSATLLALTGFVTAAIGWDWGLMVYVLPLTMVAATRVHANSWKIGERWWGAFWLGLFMVVPLSIDMVDHMNRAALQAADHTTHWSAVAAFQAVLLCLVAISFLRLPGYRVSAATLAGSTLLYGIASLFFPFDASSHRQPYAIVLIGWGIGWVALIYRDLHPRSHSRQVERRLFRRAGFWAVAMAAIAIAAGIGSIMIALLVALIIGAGAWYLRRHGGLSTKPRTNLVARRVVIVGPLLLASLATSFLDTPPNVPHRPDPGQPALLASEVERSTCVSCHGVLKNGAPIPFHGLNQSCDPAEGGCWGARTDCAGCHQIDPQLGGSNAMQLLVLPKTEWLSSDEVDGSLVGSNVQRARQLAAP